MAGRILHLLSQRPGRTGSGVTLDSLVRLAGRTEWRQQAMVGVPATESRPALGDLAAGDIRPVTFAPGPDPDLPFPVPGMSDVMPYPSSVWSTLNDEQLAAYRRRWRDRLRQVVADFAPDLIHTNHIWLLSSLVKEVAPHLPVVAACHATGLRQMELCPHLKDEVIAGCRTIDRFCVLRQDHRDELAAVLGVAAERIAVTGAGYRQDLFRPGPADRPRADQLLYIGKFSSAKGLPWLLDAVVGLAPDRPGLRLHVAGSGAGVESDELRQRMEALAPLVVVHGQLDQPALADLMRRCSVSVLPSFYEGVPLVLVEAAACGCRIVATALPGVVEQIRPHLTGHLDLVRLPRLATVDTPTAADLPRFVADLADALDRALAADPAPPPDLAAFTWDAVFERVEHTWRELI